MGLTVIQLFFFFQHFYLTLGIVPYLAIVLYSNLRIGKKQIMHQGTQLFQYCTCPAGRVTYNFH